MQLTVDRPLIDRDADLLEALRRRDATAAERLVAVFGNRAYRLATAITDNQEDAEEAVQDAYQRRRSARRRRDEISLDDILPTFHEDERHAGPVVDWSAELDDPAVQTELRSALTSALEELPDHYRAVIILHDLDGLPMAEVAECLDITVPTATAGAHRARLLLRQRLGEFMSGAPCRVEMAS